MKLASMLDRLDFVLNANNGSNGNSIIMLKVRAPEHFSDWDQKTFQEFGERISKADPWLKGDCKLTFNDKFVPSSFEYNGRCYSIDHVTGQWDSSSFSDMKNAGSNAIGIFGGYTGGVSLTIIVGFPGSDNYNISETVNGTGNASASSYTIVHQLSFDIKLDY